MARSTAPGEAPVSVPLSPAGDAAFRVRLFDRVADLPAGWSGARETAPTVFVDPRFLLTVERGFHGLARVLHALVEDRRGRPCAWASLCVFPVDLATLAGPSVQSVATRLRTVHPPLGRLKALFVGLPVSLGQSHLVIAPDAEPAPTLAALDDALAELAAREGARVVVWKEFDPVAAARLEPLLARGYRRAESPAMHELEGRFADFADYCGALTAHYRADIRRSERKFAAAGLRVVQLHDPEAIDRLYTPDVHRLYEAVVARSSVKLELLTHGFFRELTRQLGDLVTLTVVLDGDRPVAFNWGLLDGRVHHFLFCGMDYALGRDVDLYFNLMFHQLDDAFRLGPERIELGQTADQFKARLGSRPSARHVYVKFRGRLAGAVLGHAFPLLFPARPPVVTHTVFRTGGAR